jgi:glycerol-3-phosphate acyltransferase PlsX
MKIALDTMGGDNAPDEIVRGAILASRDFPDVDIICVGDEDILTKTFKKIDSSFPLPEIVHSSYAVKMDDSPMMALREYPDNSISKALDLNRDGLAQAFVSAGNTGACVAAATLMLRMVKGVQRPGIACTLPSKGRNTLVLDCGANVNARPRHLLEYAILGGAFLKYVHKKENVKVGLLNIGEESVKGNKLIKETYELLEAQKERLGFIGNVEAGDIFNGDVDVVICEGFVGNSILKGAEGLGKFLFSSIKDSVSSSLRAKLGAALMMGSLKSVKKSADPNEYGGAPLLGVNGNVIISHGSSNAWGIRNAIRTAREMIEVGFTENIENLL